VKILHLFNNWKCTGPADPALNLTRALGKRGHEVYFICGVKRGRPQPLADKARLRGVRLVEGMRLSKHRRIIGTWLDIRFLAKWLKENPMDVLHVHMDNGHLIAAKALKRSGTSALLVRSVYDGGLATIGRRTRRVISRRCDRLIVHSRAVAQAAPAIFRIPPEKVFHVEGAIDSEVFMPRERNAECMGRLGLGANDVVTGIVARMQDHRRFDVFFQALRKACAAVPNLKALVIGRGTQSKELGPVLAEKSGVGDRVIFCGYRKDDYADVINCMDFKIFLMPGSDGTCRAVRECMSMGKPVIAARRGMLAEIVDNEVNGLIIDDTAENLAAAMVRLGSEPETRERMGKAAAEKGARLFGLAQQAAIVEKCYR